MPVGFGSHECQQFCREGFGYVVAQKNEIAAGAAGEMQSGAAWPVRRVDANDAARRRQNQPALARDRQKTQALPCLHVRLFVHRPSSAAAISAIAIAGRAS